MSGSNAAAIRRRVTNVLNTQQANKAPTPAPLPPPVQARPTGQTLQNIISTMDKRISELEASIPNADTSSISTDPTITDIIDEFTTRFEMFATELVDMKDSIIKLQSYTMDVNKMLLEERIQILSDVNPNSQTNIHTDINSDIDITPNHATVDVRELVEEEINKDTNN
jgi:hypothetical protein